MHLQKDQANKQGFAADRLIFQSQDNKKANQPNRKSMGFGHIRMKSNMRPCEKIKGKCELSEDGQRANTTAKNNLINQKYWPQNIEQMNLQDKIQNRNNVKLFKRPVSSFQNICATRKQNINMYPINSKLKSFTSLDLGRADMQSICSKMTQSIIISNATTDSLNESILKPQISNSSFERIKFLGQGKFGKVYLVRHKQTGFICALKIIDKKVVSEQNVQSQFAKQLRIHSQLHSYNIIQFYGFFSDQNNFYIALEYATEGSVFSKLKGKSRLEQHQIQPIAKGVCDGLRFIHGMGFVHRDIKPENIVLQFGVPKICDFGWATNCSATDLCKSYCGTPLYLSPEMIKKQFYGTSVDIWSLGMVTYQLLVGRVPFRVWNQQDMIEILTKRIQFPEYIDRSQKCESFIRKCLQKQTYNRIQLHEALKHPFINQHNQGNNLTYEFVQEVNKILNTCT